MVKSYKGMSAKQIESKTTFDASTGFGWVTLNGVEYQVIKHDMVERNNGDMRGTLVLSTSDERIVLSY